MNMFDDMDRHTTRKPEDDFDTPFVRTRAFRLLVATVVFLLLVALTYLVLPNFIG